MDNCEKTDLSMSESFWFLRSKEGGRVMEDAVPQTLVPKPPSLQDLIAAEQPGTSPSGPKHPSERYSRSEARLDGVSKICSKTIYSAFDNEKCTEVAWIEYRDVPRSVMDKFDESLGRLIALDHPNLVKYHAGWADRKNKALVLITEQVTGDLRNWLVKKIEMAPKVYVRWVRQLCNALDYLHKSSWVHPDIASNKIFIRGTGELKIGGLAEAFFADVHFADKTFQVGIGAPEQANGVRPGPRQNVYQLGICALQVFTFHHPYRGMMLPQIVKAQLENKKPPELELLRNKDPLAYDLVSKCLEPLETRVSLAQVLKHPYLAEEGAPIGDGVKSPDGIKSPEGIKSPLAMERSNSSDLDPNAIATASSNVAEAVSAMGRSRASSGLVAAAATAGGGGGQFGAIVPAAIPAAVASSRRMIKCYVGPKSSDAPCIRIHLDGTIASLADLKRVVDSEFGGEQQQIMAEPLGLRYRDQEGDLVMITGRTTLQDVLEFAVNLELHPSASKKITSGSSLLGLMG